ncbi:MAG: S-adenosylmethionine:tRNA ribosyltransferase-isomerase, partial [Elusimicrobiales bacterium]|nr:S-adenosylmethionine:tRNA ribosyltransferase-isomerase [Elusimicrobiales bacterium]
LTEHITDDRRQWAALCRKMRAGQEIECDGGLKAKCLGMNENGAFVFDFESPLTEDYLQKYGEVPLPQYILNARKRRGVQAPPDEGRYQTIYAENKGSIAAPTAGFHFTERVFKGLDEKGIKHGFVTLHIGWGTFKPVRAEDPSEHIMMKETCQISPELAAAISEHKAAGKPLAAVGTSSMRTMETFAIDDKKMGHGLKDASLFIYPGYHFKSADIFITNLHVPESAPLYMTAAFAGRELLYKAYSHAVEQKYRFYSYGDSMIIL